MNNTIVLICVAVLSVLSGFLVHGVFLRIFVKKSAGIQALLPGVDRIPDSRNEMLFKLIAKGNIFGMDFDSAVKVITEAGAGIMNCGRCSVWLYSDDCTVIRCVDLYSAVKDEHRGGDELNSSEFPSYINAHFTELFIAADDVFSDPRTRDIPAQYFRENMIASLIDVPLWNIDKLYGVLSFEHTGKTRRWTQDDERLAVIMSTIVSLYIETRRRSSTERELQETELQLRRAGDNLTGGVIYQIITKNDGTRRFTYVSAGVRELHGFTQEQVLADPWLLYNQILQDDLDMVIRKEEESMKKMLPFDVEVRYRLKSGEIRWVRLLSHPRIMKNGDIIYDGIEIDITAGKQNELALIESEKKYRILYESMMDAFVVVDMDGTILEFNDAYLKMTGYTSDELKKLTYIDLTPEKWHTYETEIISEQVIKRGYSDLYEKEYIRKDGTVIPIEVRACYIPGSTSDMDRIWGIVRDISVRKRDEQLLRDSEENLRITLDSIGDAVISTDVNGRIVRMNPTSVRLTGWSVADAQGRPITEVFRITDSEKHGSLNPVEEVLYTGDIVFLEEDTILLSRDGREFRITDSAAPIIGDSGNLAGAVLVFRDITEQFRLEQESIQNALSFRTIFEASPYSIVIQTIDDGRYVMVNPAFEKYAGISADGIVGKTMADLGRSVDADEYNRAMELLKKAGKIDNMVMRNSRKPGDEFYTMFSSRIIDFNRKTCVLTITMDITEMKHMQEQLNQVQKMDAIGQLAGGIAHDFNNMLGGIMGAVDLLRMQAGDDVKLDKYIQMIRTTAERAAALTGKLMAFSRKSALEEMNVDLHKAIEDTTELLARTIDKRINIHLNLNAAEHAVSGDMSQLVNVFLNLGINAAHAMPHGGDLTFSTRTVELDEHYCRINSPYLEPGTFIVAEVQDTGCGIAPEYLGRVFEPFFTTREKGKGTGLGLASAYGSVRQHHGMISVYSEPGRGTLFHVYLPLSRLKPAEAEAAVEVCYGSGRVLVVDDEEIMRLTARELLQYLGYDVILAGNGKEAVGIFEKENKNIDIVLLDMVMPVMNGRECFYKLRKINPSVKVIVSSGFVLDEDINELKIAGLKGFIRKPFQTAELSRVVADVMSSGNM